MAPSRSTDLNKHHGMILSNEIEQAFYSPFGFPIHGTYDDYGYITNIKRDKNVLILEEFFGISIGHVIKYISDGDSKHVNENKDIFEKLSMTYIRTEVLEYLEDGWDKIDVENPGLYTIGSGLKKLLSSLTNKYENRINIKEYSYINSSINMFIELPINETYKDDILKQSQFLLSMGNLNRKLMPSNYGSQYNNWNETYLFNDFVNDLLIEDIKCENDVNNSSESSQILKRHTAIKRGRKLNSLLG